MATIDDGRSKFRGLSVSKAEIRALSVNNQRVAAAKIAAFFFSIAFLSALCLSTEWVGVRVTCILMLGFVYAHGLELQHEALHGNLFSDPRANRIAGFLTGAPMLVPFTLYRAYHLHHHRCVGTANDQELFDYHAKSLTNPVSIVIRIWNVVKIPSFLVILLRLMQGDRIERIRPTERRGLLIECGLLFALLLFAVTAALFSRPELVMLWIVPWLVVAEPVHFMIEVPEHIGCDRADRSILRNTRSYRTNPLWAYIMNFNNYHIEHHLFASVPAHRLGRLHKHIREAQGHCTSGYRCALKEVHAAVRDRPAS